MADKINATPAKRFFVEMLTRDIDLDDAILDLIDNSLDGLLRLTNADLNLYKNFKIEINIDKDSFEINDNCGGIPTNVAKEYAFRMGRPANIDDNIPTIGMYGIGMKRSVFKMGTNIEITSRNNEKCFSVKIPKNWLHDDLNWELDMLDCDTPLENKGTNIKIKDLYLGISTLYSNESGFVARLIEKISIHYAFVLKNGLNIVINGNSVIGKEINLLLDNNPVAVKKRSGILPFVYHEIDDGLEITVVCGLADAPPSLEEDSENAESGKVDRIDAGWTILCNDRVVLYADRSRLTGWGDGLPQFHYQFNTLVGIVNFKSNIAAKLPVTTTKRGVDASSDVFLRIRAKMIEGMRIFVNYTNKWKNKRSEERSTVLSKTRNSSLQGVISSESLSTYIDTAKKSGKGKMFKPKLPTPPVGDDGLRTIKYIKHIDDIQKIAEMYFEEKELSPSSVGAKCFDEIQYKVDKKVK